MIEDDSDRSRGTDSDDDDRYDDDDVDDGGGGGGGGGGGVVRCLSMSFCGTASSLIMSCA